MSVRLLPAALVERRELSLPPPVKRLLTALLLPASMVPVVLLAPSLVRAPATLWRHTAHVFAPAHHKPVHREPQGPRYYLVGAARLEVETFEGAAGAMTPKVGVSPFAEPAWAAQAAVADPSVHAASAPSVLVARGQELTDASGHPLAAVARRPAAVATRHSTPTRSLRSVDAASSRSVQAASSRSVQAASSGRAHVVSSRTSHAASGRTRTRR
jgi:hypothetical protein